MTVPRAPDGGRARWRLPGSRRCQLRSTVRIYSAEWLAGRLLRGLHYAPGRRSGVAGDEAGVGAGLDDMA